MTFQYACSRIVDKKGYDECYKGKVSELSSVQNPIEYIKRYEQTRLSPFYKRGGYLSGYNRRLATLMLTKAAWRKDREPNNITILDAGCGLGELTVYLACKGYYVLGVDISSKACFASEELAK